MSGGHTGDVKLAAVTGKTVGSSGGTGDVFFVGVVAEELLYIKRSTGDVKLSGCDAEEVVISTDTGDVYGSLLSDKLFIVESDMGDVDVPKTSSGGTCNITTNTGDIKITISN